MYSEIYIISNIERAHQFATSINNFPFSSSSRRHASHHHGRYQAGKALLAELPGRSGSQNRRLEAQTRGSTTVSVPSMSILRDHIISLGHYHCVL